MCIKTETKCVIHASHLVPTFNSMFVVNMCVQTYWAKKADSETTIRYYRKNIKSDVIVS